MTELSTPPANPVWWDCEITEANTLFIVRVKAQTAFRARERAALTTGITDPLRVLCKISEDQSEPVPIPPPKSKDLPAKSLRVSKAHTHGRLGKKSSKKKKR